MLKAIVSTAVVVFLALALVLIPHSKSEEWDFKGMRAQCLAEEQADACLHAINKLEEANLHVLWSIHNIQTDKMYGAQFVAHYRVEFADYQAYIQKNHPKVWEVRYDVH